MNTNKPGLPHYTGPNEGWAFWVHHGEMLEYCTDFAGRIAYIRSDKPADEISTRLRALTYLPPHEILLVCGTAWAALATARTAYDTARRTLGTAWEASAITWTAYATACTAYDTARTAYDTACTAVTPLLRPLCEQYCAGLYRDGALLFPSDASSSDKGLPA